MSENRILSAEALSGNKPFTPSSGRIQKRRLAVSIASVLLLIASFLTFQAYLASQAITVLMLCILIVDATLRMLMSLSKNVLISQGVFGNRFPMGLNKTELWLSVSYSVFMIVVGAYMVFHVIFGSYNLELMHIGSAFNFITLSTALVFLSAFFLHRCSLRSLTKKSEASGLQLDYLPIVILLAAMAFLLLMKIPIMDPVVSVLCAVFLTAKGIHTLVNARKALRLIADKDYTYEHMSLELAERFGADLLNARMKKSQHLQRYCRLKVAIDAERLNNKMRLSREIEQFMLDEFDLDKAVVQLRAAR